MVHCGKASQRPDGPEPKSFKQCLQGVFPRNCDSGRTGYVCNCSRKHSACGALHITIARVSENEFGLDHNESRSWHGWHRHVSLVMLAFAMMAAIQANKPTPKKTKSSATPRHPISSLGRSRKSAA